MDLVLDSININTICVGCLSVDRKLKAISRDRLKQVLNDIIKYFDQSVILLCWECTAVVHKTIQFQKQVKDAQICYRNHLHQTIPLKPASTITRSKITISDILPTKTYKSNKNAKNEENKIPPGITIKVNKKDEILANDVRNTEAEPLTFIKVEDDLSLDNGTCDEFEFNYDDCLDKDDERDDKDVKTLFKSNTIENKSQTEVKRRKRRKEPGFNDSDDEPLKLKKEKESEPRERRKTKDPKETEGDKVSRRRVRERPAGVVTNATVVHKLNQLGVPPGSIEMCFLSWDEVEAERQKALASDFYLGQSYKCEHCAIGFNHRSKLDNHNKKHDPLAGDFECSVCRVRCKREVLLREHRRRHRVRWRCTACGESASRASVSADHVSRAHAAPAPTHTCSLCRHEASSLAQLRAHWKSHRERPVCGLCGKTYKDKTSLRTHLLIHRGEKEFSCPRCDKKFFFKKAMELHLVTHEAHAQLYCHQCDTTFKNQMSFYQHMKYNLKHIDPEKIKFACEQCGRRFAKARRLEEHRLAVHLKATPVPCAEAGCRFACASRAALRAHVRAAHRGARAVRNHVCHTCGKAFTTKKTLEGHMNGHTGARPHRCALCPSAFGHAAALYNHNRLVHLRTKKQVRPAAPPVEDQGLPTLEQ